MLMRSALFAIIALLLGGGSATAADPAIVFQAHSFGQVLDSVRSSVNLIAGDKAVKVFNRNIREALGEKGFEGLDIGRPIFGYVVLAPKPEDITGVIALPITSEKDFLDLCERANNQKPKLAGKEKDIYELPPLDERYKALMRFSDQYAYIAYGAKPAPALEAKSLVPMRNIYIPTEKGLFASRIYFSRIPLAVKLAMPNLIAVMKKAVMGFLGLSRWNDAIVKAIMPDVDKLIARYTKLAVGADEMTVRISIDVPTANVVVEATLNGKPDTELSRIIAERKPTGNKFGGLISTPDTIAGFMCRLPLFEEELRAAASTGFEAALKDEIRGVPDNSKPFFEELVKGVQRTVKTGQFDIVGGIRGPDKNGWYTAVGAIAFEETAELEKAFKKSIESDIPEFLRKDLTWDAAKAGTVNIHTWKPPEQFTPDFWKVFGGDDLKFALAFAPQGVFVVLGPDAVGTMKDALAVKPADYPMLDIVVNPARTAKLLKKINGDRNMARVDAVFEKEDKPASTMSMTLEGGKELKMTYKIDLRLIPRAFFIRDIEQLNRDMEK
jgi:hypothetical protein